MTTSLHPEYDEKFVTEPRAHERVDDGVQHGIGKTQAHRTHMYEKGGLLAAKKSFVFKITEMFAQALKFNAKKLSSKI